MTLSKTPQISISAPEARMTQRLHTDKPKFMQLTRASFSQIVTAAAITPDDERHHQAARFSFWKNEPVPSIGIIKTLQRSQTGPPWSSRVVKMLTHIFKTMSKSTIMLFL
jgi:hypothetical protein